MTNLDSIFKSKNISLPTKVHIVKVQFSSSHVWMQRRQWHPTLVFLPAESQGRGSLVGCRLWGRVALDTAEAT